MPPMLDVVLVRALYDYITEEHGRLCFKKNDIIQVVQRMESGWWDGILDQRRGWFPSNFVSQSENVKLSPQKKYGWTKKKSKGLGRHIYFNTLTGETLVYQQKSLEQTMDDEESSSIVESSVPSYQNDDAHSSTKKDCDIPASPSDVIELIENYHQDNQREDYSRSNTVATTSTGPFSENSYPMLSSASDCSEYKASFKESSLPSHWGTKSTPDGRTYYYNMITNETSWNIQDIGSDKSASRKSSLVSHLSSPSSSVFKTDLLHDVPTWKSLSFRIENSIARLINLIKAKDKSLYLESTSRVIQDTHELLKLSGTLDRDSLALKLNMSLLTYHNRIIRSLSTMVLLVKKAVGVWPPPDAEAQLSQESQDLLENILNFALLAERSGISIDPSSRNNNLLTIPENNWDVHNELSASLSTFMDGLSKYPPSISSCLTELKIFLERDAGNFNKSELIQLTRNCVSVSGEFLSILEEVNFESSLSNDFVNLKQSMYDSISLLVSDAAKSVESFMLDTETKNQLLRSCDFINSISEQITLVGYELLKADNETDERSTFYSAAKEKSSETEGLTKRSHSMNDQRKSGFYNLKKKNGLKHNLEASSVPQLKIEVPSMSSDKIVSNNDVEVENGFSTFIRSKSAEPRYADAQKKLSKFFGKEFSEALQNRTLPSPSPSNFENESWFLGEDECEKDIVLSMEGTIKGATLPALIIRLTHHANLDANLTHAFLTTFHSFSTPREIVNLLTKRFCVQTPEGLSEEQKTIWREKKQKPIRIRVINILKSWLESFFYTNSDVEALDSIENFVRIHVKNPMPNAADQILRLIDKRRTQSARELIGQFRFNVITSAPVKDPPSPILPKNLRRIKLTDLDSLELARQLTIMESRIYNNIQAQEFIGKAWSEKDGNMRSPTIKTMISMTNQITGWVSETILLERDIRTRASLMKFFILLGEKCRSLNNFNTLMAILAALNSSPIHRLKRTRELISSKSKAVLEDLKDLMQPAQNFSNYRSELKNAEEACVPFLGLYLTDLTFIEDGNSDVIKSMPHLINVDKRMKIAEKIKEIQRFQQTYNLIEVAEIQKFLKNCLDGVSSNGGQRDADELYRKSLLLEPREREDEKIARLLQESGFL